MWGWNKVYSSNLQTNYLVVERVTEKGIIMDNKEIYELFKDAYEFEYQRKDAINSRLSLAYTALIVIIGAISYFINNIKFTPINNLKVIFFVLLAILLIILAFAFYYLFKCLFFYKYRYVARSDLIDKYIAQLRDYKEKSSKPINISEKVEDFLKSQYIDAASKNRANNKIKNGYFIRALRAIFLASIFLAFLAIPYYALKITEPTNTVYVNVTNLQEISKMPSDEQKKDYEDTSIPESDPEPTEPTPPPVEDFTEADVSDSDIETRMDNDQ